MTNSPLDGSGAQRPGVTSASRFAIRDHLYDTDQTDLLAVGRIAMGWPLFVVTTTAALLSIRYAVRALPSRWS